MEDSFSPVLFESLIKMNEFQDTIFKSIVFDFSTEDWSIRFGSSNPAFWIAGHIIANRRETFREVGGQLVFEDWEPLFHEGHPALPQSYNMSPLVDDFFTVGTLINKKLRLISKESAKLINQMNWLPGDKTLEGYIQFKFWHETYHLGQLAFIRRTIGKPLIN